MKAQITLDLSGPHAESELTRILLKLHEKLVDQGLPRYCYLLHDAEGRVVGQMEVIPEPFPT